jgi:DNA gyrase subunit A
MDENTNTDIATITPTNNSTDFNGPGIRRVNIADEMKRSYIDYAMSVIVARALPDVRDGLKPVQRRIIYAMFKEGILPGSKYSKCMGVVGEVLKKYHPHGDASVYDALARMVQPWSLRYPLIDGQGNFGSIDGDGPAAPRYTECRLDKISLRLVDNIEKDTVNFRPNYTGEDEEPTCLPTSIPTLLINGADGIAVGMATKIAPHNLTEVLDATLAMLKRGNQAAANEYKFSQYSATTYYEAVDFDIESKNIRFPVFQSDMTTDDLMEYVKGPDFPTAAEIFNVKDIKLAYETGRGRVLMRAVATIEETNKGKTQIVVTELPYQVNKARLAERIYELIKDGKIEGIADLRDESTSKEGIRLVVELKRGVVPNVILNKLFKFTEMQSAFNFNMLALVDNEPKVLALREFLEQFLRHRYEVVIRAAIFDLNKNKAQAHILEGLKIALDHIDEIIKIIRASKNSEDARGALMERFGFSDVQAQAILDMQLRRLAALERQKIEDEYNAVMATIADLTDLLDSQTRIEDKIKASLLEVREKFGDERRTQIKRSLPGEFDDEDLIEKENIIITVSHSGYIKRMKESEFRAQSRGGKGAIGSTTKEDDYVDHLIYCNTHSEILCFTNKGKVYTMRAYEVPEQSKKAKGLPIVNLLTVESGELITSVLARSSKKASVVVEEGQPVLEVVADASTETDYNFFFMATKQGVVKKVEMSEFEGIRKNGLIAINLDAGDELLFVRPTTGDSDILMMSVSAKTVRFDETKVKPTGRSSRGVRGIRLEPEDFVIMMDIVRNKEDRVLVVSEKGFGKLTPLSDFPPKSRGTKGMFGYKITSKTGKIAAARIIDNLTKEVLLMSEKGQSIRTSIESIREAGRVTSGVILFRPETGDRVSVMAVF